MPSRNIEDVYPLSPLQEGLLFHTLEAGEGASLYVSHLACRFRGLEVEAFERSWQLLVDRHPVLRTAFVWEEVDQPLQVVGRRVRLPLAVEDWRDLPPAERDARLAAYLEAERRRGFDPSRAPLMRLALFRLDEETHAFVYSHHHLILDGWSISLLLRELFAVYAAFTEGREAPLPPVRPFRDYIGWLQRRDLAAAEELWRRELAGFSEPTVLGADRAPGGAFSRRQAGLASIHLGAEATGRLTRLAARHRLTLNTVTQGAWALLLRHLGGSPDVVYGTVVSGRPAELEGSGSMLGLFINTLPVRVRVEGDPPLLGWLAELQRRLAALYEQDHAPLRLIRSWSDVPPARPLFESLFLFENYPTGGSLERRAGPLEIDDLRSAIETNYPLTVTVTPGERLSVKAAFDRDRFEAAAIGRMLAALEAALTVLSRLDDDLRRPLSALPWLGAGERHQLLVEGNDTRSLLLPWKAPWEAVPNLVARRASEAPEAVAVVAGGHHLSYGELARRSGAWARRLRQLGVGPEVRVAVAAGASVERVIGLLAVLVAGGAYLPLDPDHPRERLAFQLADAGVGLLLAGGGAQLPPEGFAGVRRLDLDGPLAALPEDGPTLTVPVLAPAQAAYVIYTSGSTGRPKGVEVSHRGLANLVAWHLEAFGITAADRASQTANLAFDASVWEVWPYLARGATLVLVDRRVSGEPERLRDRLVEERITAAFLATPLAEGVLGLEWPPDAALRLLLTGGDRLGAPPPPGLPFTLVNAYGPTEGTVVATAGRVPAAPAAPVADSSGVAPAIGRPIAGVRAYVVGFDGRLAPAGVPGELWIGGESLARGYLRRPRLTAERFVPDPWETVCGGGGGAGERLYRTGDRVRLTSVGELEFLGRIDRQVKLRGFRIELGEIEAALARHPQVAAAAVGVRGEVPRLVAWVEPDGEGEVGSGELAAHLRRHLPAYMLPATYLWLPELPRLASGKVDRRALPSPPPSAPGAPGSGEAFGETRPGPAEPVRETLAAIWAELLHTGPLSGGESFFELGGHSLVAVQVASRVREALGVDLPVRALFESPSLAELAERVAAMHREQRGVEPLPLGPVEPAERGALSFPQQRLWFLEQLQPGLATYNIATAAAVAGPLAAGVLEQALGEVARRHESLRTSFGSRAGEPCQEVSERPDLGLAVVDLSGLGTEEREALVEDLTSREARRPFDLARGPLARARLLRLANGEQRLLVTLHHIVADGWSMGVLVEEVGTLYRAFGRGEASPLGELPLQYADYAFWQREWLRGGRFAPHLDYWRRQLGEAPAALELPTDRPRPRLRTSLRGAHAIRALDVPLAGGVQGLARRRSATLFMTLLAAFEVVLGRYAGQEDVVVGTPVANRSQRALEGLIGFFLNSLPLRTDLSGDPTFLELVDRVRETALDGFAYQEVPFEVLLETLQPERNLGRTPLFQVMFNLLDFDPGETGLEEPAMEILGPRSHAANFELTLYARSRQDRIELSLVYDVELFDAATAERLLGHLHRLLEAAVEEPDARISTLPLLAAAERRQLIARRNAVAPATPFLPFPREEVEGSIVARFARQVAAGPERPAVRTPRFAWTYAELEARAAGLAGALLARRGGAEPGRVGVLLDPDAPMLAALLGVLAAGETYVPLDPSYPRERLAYMLADSGAGALVADEEHRELARELAADRLPVVGAAEAEPFDGAVDVAPDTPAYILYTSGSTGRPKGVVQSHRNVLHHIAAYTNALHIAAGDRLSLLSSFAFDAAVMDIFGALLNGAALLPVDLRREGFEEAVRWLRQQGVTLYHSTPTVFRHFAAAVDPGERVPSVRAVVLGGEEVVGRDVELCRRRFGEGCLFVNGLGPTESTMALQFFTLADGRGLPGAVPVGYPVEHTEVLLLDGEGGEVGLYAAGEIAVRSRHVALGYWRQPELTAAAFTGEGENGGARIYRTGDLGRRLPDGAIEFVGRKDAQVKIRGHRVETGEVEAVLVDHPGVREAVVVPRREPSGSLGLAAYLVSEGVSEGVAEPDRGELRRLVASRLPGYMVPFSFTLLAALPLTPTHKVDRGALPDPEPPGVGERAPAAPLRGPLEEIVAQIWCDVLGLDAVGPEEDFFELGGHSLLGTQVVARVRESLGVELPLRRLFESPTVRGLAAAAGAGSEAGGAAGGAPPIPRLAPGDDAPLSFAQQRLWFLDHLQGGGAVYNLPVGFGVRGDLHTPSLEQALGELVRRHAVLCTRFPERAGKPVQRIEPPVPRPLPVVDLGGLGPAAGRREARRLNAEEARRPFDLERGPLFRGRLLRLEARLHHLLLTLHHTVGDGWSIGILARELAALSDGFAAGRPSPLGELPLQYGDFAAWQRRRLDGEPLERLVAFWKEELAGFAPLVDLPVDRPRPAVQAFRGGQRFLDLPAELHRRLLALGRERGATLFMTLVAAFEALLLRLAGSGDFCLGTPVAGRQRVELEELIGLFANTLVLRARLTRELTFGEALDRVREGALAAYAHQELPFEKLVDELGVVRDLSHTPVFQVMFVLQNQPAEERDAASALAAGGLELSSLASEDGTAKFDLTLTALEGAGGVRLRLEHDAELFDATTASRLLRHFRCLLAGAVAAPATRLGALPLLTPAERQQLVAERACAPEAPVTAPLHELFAAAVRQAPDSIALTFAGEHLSYRRLDEESGRLAHRLRREGAGPEVRVGLHLMPSVEMVVAILGILKSGAAYLPLDPTYPAERLRTLLEDGEIPLLVTTSELAPELPPHAALEIPLDAVWGELRQEATGVPETGVSPASLAYVIYTSGSTGRPKGVEVTHANVVRLLATTRSGYDLGAGDVWTLFHSYAFDFSVWELWGALAHGGRLAVVPYWDRRSPDRLWELLQEEGATVLSQTPTAFRQLLAVAAEKGAAAPSLRLVVFGGEALDPRALEPWFTGGVSPACRLSNMYGITETTVHVTWRDIGPQDLEARRAGSPIGEAIPDTVVHLLEADLEPVALGVAGEIHVGGPGVARGYTGRPAETAARFVPDPYGGVPGGRLYRSGDLARRRPGGGLEFLGRRDHQVKIRGHRIELGEVEAALAGLAAVRQAVVVARPGEAGDRLVAYVVPRADRGDRGDQEGAPAAGELRRLLRERLPEHMVPAAFLAVDELPRTPSGKLDVAALPEPDGDRPDLEADFEAPRGEAERTLAAIWRRVLGVARVGRRDDFFELGGDSILSIQVVALAREAGLALAPRQIFQFPTVAELAERAVAVAPAAEEEAVPGPVPLTPIQEWFFALPLPHPEHWNQALFFEVREELAPGPLSAALGGLVRRHDALRLRFRRAGEGWSQELLAAADVTVSPVVADLSRLAAADRRAVLEGAASRLQVSFDLGSPPLLRAAFFSLGAGEPARLLLVAHHLVVDGVSWRVLLEDLETLYRRAAAGEPLRLSLGSTPYSRWAERLRQHAASAPVRAEHDHWLEVLAADVPPLPLDHPEGGSAATEGSTERVVVSLDPEETRELLEELPRAFGTGVDDALLAALVEALGSWDGRRLARIDLESHGREDLFDDVDLSRTVGWFTAIYPVTLDLEGTRSPGEALRRVREALGRVPGRGLGFGLLRQAASGAEPLGPSTAEVSFNYLGQLDRVLPEASPFALARESAGAARDPDAPRPYRLAVDARTLGGRLQAVFSYSRSLHRRETVERLAEDFAAALRRLLEEAGSGGEAALSPLDFPEASLDQEELDLLLARLGAGDAGDDS